MAELTIDGITLKFKESKYTGDQWEHVAFWVLNGGAASIEENADSAESNALKAIQAAKEAETSASSVDDIARQSESYAVGGTGTRDGENTDNAKYYCEQAHAIAGEGMVFSVNGVRADEFGNVEIDSGGVKTINGNLPDESGNATVDTGVMTVNGTAPDENGNVVIDAGGVKTINNVAPDENGNINVVTMTEVNAAIDLAIIGAIEEGY